MHNHFIRATSNPDASVFNRALFFDGINDICVSQNSPFYNFGIGPFVFAFTVYPVNTLSQYKLILSKGAGVDQTGIRISCGDMNNAYGNGIYFFVGSTRYNFSHGVDIRNKLAKLVIQRVGSNDAPKTDVANWPRSNRNPDNYEVFVDGLKVPWVHKPAELPSANFDNAGRFILGQLEGSTVPEVTYKGLIENLAVYGGTFWTQAEVDNFVSGQFSPDGTKGIWGFNEISGSQALDQSSVQEHLSLQNYTEDELGNPDATTNKVRFPTESIWTILPNETKVVSITAKYPLQTRFIQRFQSALVAVPQYKLTRATGEVVTGAAASWSGIRSALSLGLLEGDVLELTLTNSGGTNVIGLMY